jgi:uncharacterized protein (UPF0332 family)
MFNKYTRGYNACYHRVIALNKKLGFDADIQNKDSHSNNIHKITRYIQKSDSFTKDELTELKRKVEQLKGHRHDTDYKHSGSFNLNRTKYILENSEVLYDKLMNIS